MTTGTWSGSEPTCEGGSIFTYMTSVMKFNMYGKSYVSLLQRVKLYKPTYILTYIDT